MVNPNRLSNSSERWTTSINIIRNNFSVWKGLDKQDFNKFLESFWDETENNKVILSKFLNSKNIKLSQLWDIKINIDNINNFIQNKPNFSKHIEEQITKLFLKNFYEQWKATAWFKDEFENRFCQIQEIDGKNFDFKAIQVWIIWFSDSFSDTINETTVSNNEIFKALNLNQILEFSSQNVSAQEIILNILEFEVRDLIQYVKNRGEEVTKDMEKTIVPTSMISEIFDKVEDPEIEKLIIQKWQVSQGDETQVKEINKMIRKKYIENFEKMWMNQEFISVLKKLVENDFNFSILGKREQTILRNTLMSANINKAWNKRAKYTDFDQEEFQKFMQDLYDFEKDDMKLTVSWGWDISFKIKKEVKNGPTPSFLDIENFKNMDMIQPIVFTVNIDDNDEETIKILESEWDNILRSDWIMETHITKSGPISIWNWYEFEICGKNITKSQLDELLDCDSNEDLLNEKLKSLWLYDELKDLVISVKQEMFSPQNVYRDIDEYWEAQNSDQWYWPYWYRFCIFEELLKKIDLKITKRNIIFDGNNIDKLSQLYIMSKLWWDKYFENLWEQQDKKIENVLWDYDRDSDEELGDADWGRAKAEDLWDSIKDVYDDYKNSDDQEAYFSFEWYDIEEDAERFWENLDEEWKRAFKERLEELCENDPDIDDDREEITVLVNDLLTNLEHPRTSTDVNDSWENVPIQQEKSEEEKWKDAWNNLLWDKECKFEEWTRLYFDLWETQLPPKDITDSLKSYYCFKIVNVWDDTFTVKAIWWDLKSNLSGKEYTLPKTSEQLESMNKWWNMYKVRNGDKRDWNSCLESINKAGFFKKFTAFWNMEWQVKLDWNKFVNEKWEEIKYFDRVEWYFDDRKKEIKDWWQWEKLYKYEIQSIDRSKWTVKIRSMFDDYDENYQNVKYKYENELPFEQFILLMEWKRLKWYTQEQQEEMETKYKIEDPKRLATKWRRRWISIWSIANVFKNTTKAIKAKMDENKKEQDEVLENYLFSQEWLDLYWKLWWLFGNSAIWDAMKKSQYEFYTNRENRTWKRIEEWYKIFESDPNYSEFFAEHLQYILAKQWYIWHDKDRYKFAAAFLIMVKKEWPYPRVFANQKDKWKRVENILWPEHKARFLNFYEKKKHELEQEKDMWHQSWARLALQEELNKMEIQYIVSTIDWRAPYGPASNEFMLKSIWSLKFMSTLEENAKWYYNKHEEEKNSLETFYAAEESYLRNMWSGKFQKALPALERMCEVCKTPWEVFRVKWYLLWAMLMWTIKNNSSAKTIKSFWGTCRSMWFAPWYWMRDIEHQDKVKALLDGVTNGDFSKGTGYKVSDFIPGNIKDWKYSFTKKFQSYWNSHGSDLLKKIEDPTYKNGDNDKSIIDLANEKDNPNNYIFKDIIKNSTTNEIDSTNGNIPPIFAQESPLSATSNIVKSYIPENWKYSKVKNEEDISNAEDFWTAAGKAIPSGAEADQETVDFIFNKYFNRFDSKITSNVQTSIIRSIPLIQEEYKKGHYNTAKYMLWYMFKWYIHESSRWAFPKPEFENVMNKFVEFFYNNIEKINTNTIKSTFDSDAVADFEKPYVMLNWKQFRNYIMQTTNGWRNKNTYNRLVKLELHRRGKETSDAINYEIGDMWNKTRHYCLPDFLPDDTMDDLETITVDMSKSDKDIREEENREYYS